MILQILSFSLFLIAISMADEKGLTRAYSLGHHSPHSWQNDDLKFHPDPFASDGDAPAAYLPASIKPPFKSPHFRSGDKLWDFHKHPDFHEQITGKVNHLIFNETSGRIILFGDHHAHATLAGYAHAKLKREEKSLAVSLKIYSLKLTDSKAITLETLAGKDPAFEARFLNKPGEFAEHEFGPSDLNLTWEARIDDDCTIVECRLTLSGAIDTTDISYQGGFTATTEAPLIFMVGKDADSDLTHLATIRSEIFLTSGIRFDDLILDQDGQQLSRFPRAPIQDAHLNGERDPQTGHFFKAFQVPPAFLSFIATSGSGSIANGDDPFAADVPDPKPRDPKLKYAAKWPARVIALPTDQVVDTRNQLRENGVSFAKNDWAFLNVTTHTLFVLASETDLELVEGIGCFGCRYPPHNVHTSLTLVESAEALTPADLTRGNLSIIARAESVGHPGQEVVLQLEEIDLRHESQIEANEEISLKLNFQTSSDQTKSTTVKADLTIPSAAPRILQAHKQGGKWLTLILKSSELSIYDVLPQTPKPAENRD